VNKLLAVTTLIVGLALGAAGAAAETHEVRMLNESADDAMLFKPGFLRINRGDSVQFIPADPHHNVVAVHGPEGAALWRSGYSEELLVTLDVEGVYIIRCEPHTGLGMVGIIQVGEPTNLAQAQQYAEELSFSIGINHERLANHIGQVR
jgi:pseudoazurin